MCGFFSSTSHQRSQICRPWASVPKKLFQILGFWSIQCGFLIINQMGSQLQEIPMERPHSLGTESGYMRIRMAYDSQCCNSIDYMLLVWRYGQVCRSRGSGMTFDAIVSFNEVRSVIMPSIDILYHQKALSEWSHKINASPNAQLWCKHGGPGTIHFKLPMLSCSTRQAFTAGEAHIYVYERELHG